MEATSHVAGWDEGRETKMIQPPIQGEGAVLSRYSSYFISQALIRPQLPTLDLLPALDPGSTQSLQSMQQ